MEAKRKDSLRLVKYYQMRIVAVSHKEGNVKVQLQRKHSKKAHVFIYT